MTGPLIFISHIFGSICDWIDLPPVNAVMDLRVPYSAGNFLSRLGPVNFSGRTLLNELTWHN